MDVLSAKDDFQRARQGAALERILATFTGRSVELLSYEEVRKKLKAVQGNRRELKDVPLDAIIGSVGRIQDFTRKFLPRRDSLEHRWAKVDVLVNDSTGLPPVELYQIGETYFVRDGHHRVSVARQNGHTHVEAYVTEVRSRVPLAPEIQPRDFILKAEEAEFLERTRLDALRPEAHLSVTALGGYADLMEHIEVHRYFMGLDLKRDIASDEAVAHWYDTVFTPVAEVIREQGVLSEFPGRTQADLYLWILRHRAEVEEELGWEIGTEAAAANFAAHHSPGAGRVAARVGEKILDAIVPADFDARPPAVEWRKQVAARHEDAVFAGILVAVDADPTRWHGLEQSLQIARAEGARVHGLYVVSSAAAAASEQTAALQVAFDRRCQETGVAGRLAVEVGNLVDTISARAQWVDLIVLDHAPTTKANATTFDRRWRSIVRRCPSHLLFVPGPAQPMKRAMLVYDGGPTAREALRVAGHMGSQHKLSLSLFATSEGDAHRMKQMLATAQDYLRERGIDVAVIKADGPIAEAILNAAEQEKIDLIITGSYSQHPWFAPGNYVAELLRLTSRPVLMCR